MRYLLSFFLLFLFACTDNPDQDVVVKGQAIVRLPVNPQKVKGMYAGEFKGSPLSIVLTNVSDKHAAGYNLHKGHNRNLAGVVEFSKDSLHLYLVEPGDSRTDGQFHLSIDTTNWRGAGSWKSFVTGTQVSFRFQKREIQKEVDEQVFVDALSNYITLKPDGSCSYNYVSDSTSATQPLILNGRYKREPNKVNIYWEKNSLYPSGKSVFYVFSEKAFKNENYTQQSLRGEGKVFNEMVFE